MKGLNVDNRFIAALDQSAESTPKTLDRYSVEYTEDNMMDKIHDMRLRIIGSPAFNDNNIMGAILFKDSVTRGMVNILDKMGIDTFLKIDSGLKPDGTMKQFPVKQMLEWATNGIGPKIYGTKMRSVVKSIEMVDEIVKQQFTVAQTVSEYGLVPIIEPEVPIDHPNKAEIEDVLVCALELYLHGKDFKVILKLTPPEAPNLYHNLTVKHNVERVVFLSGGYSTNEACNKLGLNENVTASFSRALTENLHHDLDDEAFNKQLSDNIETIKSAGN